MSTPHYEDAGLRLWHGPNMEILPTFADASFDSIVTDPPYELGFMGKGWDSSGIAYDVDVWRECLRVLKPGGHLLAFGGSRTWHRMAVAIEDAGFEMRDSIAWLYGSGFPKSMDVAKAIEKVERGDLVRAKLLHFAEDRGVNGRWLEERGVASAASFGDWTVGGHVPSDRNWEIVKAALEVSAEEEAAFEREVLVEARSRVGDGTVYGLGHTGRRVGAAVTEAAREWEGWGTALKPAFEPIVVARKPFRGTVAANVLTHGTGALNIDATRVEALGIAEGWHRDAIDEAVLAAKRREGEASADRRYAERGGTNFAPTPGVRGGDPKGRHTPNVLLDGSQADTLDAQTGVLTSGKLAAHHARAPKDAGILGAYGSAEGERGYGDSGGASRFFPTFDLTPEDVAWQARLEARPTFRYEAKAPTSERPNVEGTVHATVKPLALIRWLVRLVTRPGGRVLDLYAGSGTTGEAALLEGMEVDLIELEEAHLPLILARVRKPLHPAMFGDWEETA